MIIIKWVLMLIGTVMVSAVFYLTCKVIHEGVNGTLHKNRTMKIGESMTLDNLTLTELGKDL